MEPTTRLELVTPSLPRTCSTTELRGPIRHSFFMERETGLEPATNGLEGRDSTTELLPRHRRSSWRRGNGAGGWIRTTVGLSPADLQSAAFSHSATPAPRFRVGRRWSWRRDSNPQPADYKSAALPLSYASSRSSPALRSALKEHTSASRRGKGTVAQRFRRCKRCSWGFSVVSGTSHRAPRSRSRSRSRSRNAADPGTGSGSDDHRSIRPFSPPPAGTSAPRRRPTC